jgi:alkanesulfonate monooxygenase SsuD/methylene tetrahydromethanopterin reductase-like flavin-dependent oxidoreductase (luciferase family)
MNENTVHYAVYLPPFGPFGDPNVLVELAVRAEAAGWDGVFLWDHVVSGELPIADPWTTLAAIAQATERVRLGPTVTPLSRRRPWVVARQAATLSRLSAGRLIVGAGLGSDESGDFSRFGETTDPTTRSAMLAEGLQLMRAIWAGEAIEHAGSHYRVRLPATDVEPTRIPIWMASSTNHARVLTRATHCDGIFPNPDDHELTPDEIARLRDALHQAGLPSNRPFDIAIAGNASSAWQEKKDVDLKGLAEAGMTWWLESLMHFDPLQLSMAVVDAGPPRD